MLGSEDTGDQKHAEWAGRHESPAEPNEDCSPTRVCRNARDFSFDGFAEEGGDLQAAWRDTLEREGKLSTSAESIRDLILGRTSSN